VSLFQTYSHPHPRVAPSSCQFQSVNGGVVWLQSQTFPTLTCSRVSGLLSQLSLFHLLCSLLRLFRHLSQCLCPAGFMVSTLVFLSHQISFSREQECTRGPNHHLLQDFAPPPLACGEQMNSSLPRSHHEHPPWPSKCRTLCLFSHPCLQWLRV
jgi:hypothetical protein